MRNVFLILLTFLLPLRGMVGDAMAVQMMMPTIHGVSVAENSPPKAGASLSKAGALGFEKLSAMPCHDVVDTQIGVAAPDGCASCEVCHLSAFVGTLLPASVAISAEARPAPLVVHLASAELVLFAKPPIL